MDETFEESRHPPSCLDWAGLAGYGAIMGSSLKSNPDRRGRKKKMTQDSGPLGAFGAVQKVDVYGMSSLRARQAILNPQPVAWDAESPRVTSADECMPATLVRGGRRQKEVIKKLKTFAASARVDLIDQDGHNTSTMSWAYKMHRIPALGQVLDSHGTPKSSTYSVQRSSQVLLIHLSLFL